MQRLDCVVLSPMPHVAIRARASDVPSDLRGNIGVDVVRQIENHFGLPIVAHNVHDSFEVVAWIWRSKTPFLRNLYAGDTVSIFLTKVSY